MYDAFEAKDFDLCMELYETAKVTSHDVWENEDIKRLVRLSFVRVGLFRESNALEN